MCVSITRAVELLGANAALEIHYPLVRRFVLCADDNDDNDDGDDDVVVVPIDAHRPHVVVFRVPSDANDEKIGKSRWWK